MMYHCDEKCICRNCYELLAIDRFSLGSNYDAIGTTCIFETLLTAQ